MGLSHSEHRIFESLPVVLEPYVEQADIAAIIDQLRDNIVGTTTPLKDVHSQVLNCTKCPDMEHNQHIAKFNLKDPDLLIVNGYPWTGRDSDVSLAKVLKNNGFGSHNIAFTSLVRCFPNGQRTPDAEEISRCTDLYLYSEIEALKPKLIALIGSVPTKLFLGEDASIVKANGQIFWLGTWAMMPIMSPQYAEQSNKMGELNNALSNAFGFIYPNEQSISQGSN